MKVLSELLSKFPHDALHGNADVDISGITFDSRKVRPGSIFVAISGIGADRHQFLKQALSAGAAALVVRSDRRELWQEFLGQAPLVVVEDTQESLAALSAAYFDHPARSMLTVGVTGTDGKSTTTELCAQLFRTAGQRVGMLSTVAFRVGERRWLNALHATTLESSEVQAHLAEMRDAGCETAIIESSSHGLALHRVDECEFDVGIFTTLTPDHLDFHQTMESYREAKGRLFEMLDRSVDKGRPKAAVLNADDPAWTYFRSRTNAQVWTYGIREAAVVRAETISQDGAQTRFSLVTPAGTRTAAIHLPGIFNISNTLAAVSAALSQGVNLDVIVDGLPFLRAPEGRMERIEGPQPFTVLVDFAATPDALRKALGAARALASGSARVLVLFGCAGERDPGRRSGMGAAAAALADGAVFTNEDPRSEEPTAIIDAIVAAFVGAGRTASEYLAIPDRREAIDAIFALARPGDVVLLCGKATEPFIEMADGRIPWDERATARELLAARFG